MGSFPAASKAVLDGAALIVAAVDELDLHDAVRLTLLAKKGIDDGGNRVGEHLLGPRLGHQLMVLPRRLIPVGTEVVLGANCNLPRTRRRPPRFG